MSEELLINVSPMESRVAILNDGVLSELYIERHNKMGLVGNIYVGTVVRVLPGMQAAFVDIGQSRTAFLHVNDMQKIKKQNEPIKLEQPQSASVTHSSAQLDTQTKAESASFSTAHEDEQHTTPSIESVTQVESEQSSQHNSPQKNNPQKNSQQQNNQQDSTQSGHFADKRLQQGYQSTALHSALPPSATQPSAMTTATLPLTRQTAETQQAETNTLVLSKNPANKLSHPTQSLFGKPISNTARQGAEEQRTEGQSDGLNRLPQNKPIADNKFDSAGQDSQLTTQMAQTNSQADMHTPDVPSFRVLPTVTEVLRKDTLTPKPPAHHNAHKTQATSRGEGRESHRTHDDNYTSSGSSKRQAQISPDELIQNRLREGQQVLVQVTKDQLGTKGARLTTNISLPSRYLVYIPSADNIGISQRIDNIEERQRLRTELANLMQKVSLTGGVIARTAAESIPIQKLEEDIYYLLQLWRTIQARQKEVHAHQSFLMVYQELSLPLRSIRDLVHEGTERVLIDEANTYEYLKQFAQEFVPMIYPRIVPYHSQQPMFDVFRVEEDLRDALKRRVDLKSGGYLIIDQTEAMTTIDVNTGSYVGGRSLEDTVYKTNLEATHAIARQLRLRNLGGIIILDFIDMQEQEHRDDVLISLQTQLAEDYARTNITQISELGLVEMTRKRTRESLEQQLCEPCSTCQGKGFIKTAETVCFEIFREIMRCARTYNAPKQFTVVAHATVIDLLLTSEADTVADLEYLLGRVITFEVETLYTQEQYDIVLD